jgi:hypothetical protein
LKLVIESFKGVLNGKAYAGIYKSIVRTYNNVESG